MQCSGKIWCTFYLFLISLFIFTNVASAFNWDKCNDFIAEKWDFMGSAIFFSTSGFTSSTGDCAMNGIAKHDKKVFIAYNIEKIKVDSARGGGKYLSAYAALSGCSKLATLSLGNNLQNNFLQVFGSTAKEHSPREVYERIEGLISNDPELRVDCKPKA
jgi:hypothetical protein